MSEIKLPVTVLQPYEQICHEAIFRDDNGDDFTPHEIAAALNAAPKRAFEDLTIRELCTMMEGAEVSEEELLSRLQAFAAPVAPAWQPIETAPKDGVPILCFTPDFQAIFSPQSGIDVLWWDEGAWLYNAEPVAFPPTHWQPLPAAPETQGGREDE